MVKRIDIQSTKKMKKIKERRVHPPALAVVGVPAMGLPPLKLDLKAFRIPGPPELFCRPGKL